MFSYLSSSSICLPHTMILNGFLRICSSSIPSSRVLFPYGLDIHPLEDTAIEGIPLSKWNLSINYGIKTGLNDAFIISTEKRDELIAADPKSAEIIRPILRGRDIKRYNYVFADLWIINVHNGIKTKHISPIDINDYPAVKSHLDNYYDQLCKRADKGDTPYNLRNCVYMNDFLEQKIVWGNLCLSAQFSLAEEV